MYVVRIKNTSQYLIHDDEGKFLGVPQEGKKKLEFFSHNSAQKEADSLTNFGIECIVEKV
jgi:hypothetical protein